MDNASSIKERLKAMTELYYAGIHTVLFMSPIFPYITEWKEIIDETLDIGSVNQKVLDFFPEYKLKRNQEQLKDLTIENFLTMTVPYKYKYEPYTKVFGSDNWGEKVLELIGGKEQIGERFHYSTTAICGGFMEKMKRSKF